MTPQPPTMLNCVTVRGRDLDRIEEVTGISLASVQRAAERISDVAVVTPVLAGPHLDAALYPNGSPSRFFFKAESLQRTGSFKFRGAYNAIASLMERQHSVTKTIALGLAPDANGQILDSILSDRIVTHSSGNFGMATACAASLLGLQSYVVVPHNSLQVKKDGIRESGAELVLSGPTWAERLAAAEEVARRVGGTVIQAGANADVIAGQGTIALELLQQVQDLDAIIVPVGTGGLISGIAIAAKSINPNITILGAEPKAADDTARSFKAGRHVEVVEASNSVADGLRNHLSPLSWTIVSCLVDNVITASEEDIVNATKLVWSSLKLIVEPSSGVAVAVAMSEDFRALKLRRVAIVLSGGNISIGNPLW